MAMAKFAAFFAFFSVLAVSARSRTLPTSSKAGFLDVSAAISKTQGLFKVDSRSVLPSMHEVHPVVSTHSAFSFQLHPRLSVRGTSEKDYKKLTLARIGRDSARVKAIQTRLDLASLGIRRKADLTPVEAEVEVEKLEGPVISGTSSSMSSRDWLLPF